MLGNATLVNKFTTYSVIEIGNQLLQHVVVPNTLDNFLGRALHQPGDTRLFMSNLTLLGVGLPDGKLYCYPGRSDLGLLFCILGILTTPLFGIGLLAIAIGATELRNARMANDLRAQGAIAVFQ